MNKKEKNQKERATGTKLILVRYQNKENGLFHFRYEDAAGETILTSKRGYASSRSRDKGIIHTKANLSSYEIIENGGEYFFIIKSSGNNAELAKSKSYSKKEDAEQGHKLFKEAVNLSLTKKHQKEKNVSNPETPATKIEAPPRYTFRLTFYPSDDESEKMNGNIDYILGNKKKNFKGLDINTIHTFVKENLPLLQEKEPETTKVPKTSTKNPVIVLEPESPHLKMEIIEEGETSDSSFIHSENGTEIQLTIDPEAIVAIKGDYEVSVFALSLESGRKTLIASKSGCLSADGQIRFAVFLNQFPSGPYRIIASLQWLGHKVDKEAKMKTSKLIQVFSHAEAEKGHVSGSKSMNMEFIKDGKTSSTKKSSFKPSPESAHLKMEFIEEGKPSRRSFIQSKKVNEIQLVLDTEERLAKTGDCEASVFALSLETGKKILIGNKRGFLSNEGQIRFPVFVNQLTPGTYRMLSSLQWQSEKSAEKPEMNTSSLVQVF